MNYGILPKLTKNYLMQHISQEDIFAHYLDISIGEIYNCIDTNNLILDPTRTDTLPTFGFKYSGNRLRARDFAGGFRGDCFDLVADQLNLNANSKSGFYIILDQIAQDFNLHTYANRIKIKHRTVKDTSRVIKESSKSIIKVTTREWNKIDARYWGQYHITRKGLKYFNIYPAMNVWVNGILRYEYNPQNPAYIYYFGKDENGIDEIKVYYPFRKKIRFITNTTVLQGKSQLLPARVCLVTKAYKDVVAIRSHTLLQAVAPASETHLLSKEDYDFVKRNCDYIFSLMDFDRTGKRMAKKLREEYGIPPLFVNQTASGIKLNHTAKDYTDLIAYKGLDYTNNLVDDTINHYEQQLDNFKLIHNDYDKFY